ncbi:MAG: hypothetical protein ACRENO_09545 [Thermodesulfobacteriota bacterium]
MYKSKRIVNLKKRIKVGLINPNNLAYISELTEDSIVIDTYENYAEESIISCEMKEDDQLIKFNAEVISISRDSVGYKIKAKITNQLDIMRKFYMDKLQKKGSHTNNQQIKKKGLFK